MCLISDAKITIWLVKIERSHPQLTSTLRKIAQQVRPGRLLYVLWRLACQLMLFAIQPGGLADSSRWLKRSENHRNKSTKELHPEGVREPQRESLEYPSLWHPFGVRSFLSASTGGLRFATTTGYFLATVWVASFRLPRYRIVVLTSITGKPAARSSTFSAAMSCVLIACQVS